MLTLIRLLLKEQSAQDLHLHCLPFRLHLLDALLYGNNHIINILVNCSNFFNCQFFFFDFYDNQTPRNWNERGLLETHIIII